MPTCLPTAPAQSAQEAVRNRSRPRAPTVRITVVSRILAIESSCDETAAAVVEDGERVLSSIVASQLDTHAKYGGVVPELASREHLRSIVPVVRRAIGSTGLSLSAMDAIAVT